MDSLTSSPTSPTLKPHHPPVVLPTTIASLEDARALVQAHAAEEQDLISQFTAEDAKIDESNRDAFKHVYDAALELEDDNETRLAIEATYGRHQELFAEKEAPLDPPSSSSSSSDGTIPAPRFVTQAVPKDPPPPEGLKFAALQTHYMGNSATFNFHNAGMNGHGTGVAELFDRSRTLKLLDYEIFMAVFEATKGAPLNTIEGQIRSNFVALWKELRDERKIPFVFLAAQQIDSIVGGKDLQESFSMLHVEDNFFQANGLEEHKQMIIDLFDGVVNRYDEASKNAAEAAIAAVTAKFDKPEVGTPAAKIKARLEALPKAKLAPTPQGRSWGQIFMMGAAAVLSIYLVNRFVVPKLQQWYRGNNTQA